MLCKNLRSAAKNSRTGLFFHPAGAALVRIPLINKTKNPSDRFHLPKGFWRRQRDSNPRAVADKRFSRPPRYDRFDMPPYFARALRPHTVKVYLILCQIATKLQLLFFGKCFFSKFCAFLTFYCLFTCAVLKCKHE